MRPVETMTLQDAATGAVLDTIGIDAGGVTCVTGEAVPVLAAIREAYDQRGVLLPANLGGMLDGWTDGRVRLVAAPVVLAEAWEPTVPNVLLDLREAGSDAQLRKYWTSGKGAGKIKWGKDHDFDRCVRHLGKYVADPKGLCNEYHQLAVGAPPGKGH
jgi:hypothetical protein